MRRTLWSVFLPILLLQCAPDAPTAPQEVSIGEPAPAPITLQALAVGEQLRIRVESWGCFHHWKSRLTLDRADPSGIEQQTVFADLHGVRRTETPATSISTELLTPNEVARLDRYFARLRLPQQGMCTTQTTFHLSLFQGDSLLREELLEDRICADDDSAPQQIPAPPEPDSVSAVGSGEGQAAGTAAA